MPRIAYDVVTPLGTFVSAKAAAAAHHCSQYQIMTRIETDPANYTRIQREARPSGSAATWARRTRWPLSWAQYRVLELQDKEAIYEAWCRNNSQDPNSEVGAEAFFDAMDAVQDQFDNNDVDTEIDLDDENTLS
jgi:hypothetical protein